MEQAIVAQAVAERERRMEWEGRAVEAQERERRISRNFVETLERARMWELRTAKAEEREEIWRNRAWGAYRRAEGLDERIAFHERSLTVLEEAFYKYYLVY
ncbi:hypothetical protein LOD99_15486 [Oopsacas minuta]|uniref:Uncharacterized protein n=1 Tax=Oopsacas minuta TaxID=111878 RepID=A0AAV7KAE1_9METZ|nr:hypothetical protein LOD99_15486 [Oopsacas minuta]